MPMAKKGTAAVLDKPASESVVTQVAKERPPEVAVETKVMAPKPEAFGRKLTPYEVLKDRRIAAAGVVQSLSQIYVDQAMGLKSDQVDAYVEQTARKMMAIIMTMAQEGA